MALIDLKCQSDACGHTFEAYRSVKDWPKTPPCEVCQGPTEQLHLPKRTVFTIEPIVVFKAPDGTHRFPGDANGAAAAKYQRLGYTRIEIRSAAEMRTFEKRMNEAEYSVASRKTEVKQRQREAREQVSRSELRRQMQSMSRFGREVAKVAMQRNDDKPRERTKEIGFHSEIFSYDRSNREPSLDERGRRRRD